MVEVDTERSIADYVAGEDEGVGLHGRRPTQACVVGASVQPAAATQADHDGRRWPPRRRRPQLPHVQMEVEQASRRSADSPALKAVVAGGERRLATLPLPIVTK